MPDDFDPFKQGAIAVDPDTFDPFKQGAIAVDPAPSTSPLSEKAVTDTQDWMRTMVLQNPRGLIEPGNIDLYHRPIVQNADGSLDAVRPQSVGIDGREVLLPSVAGDGRHLTVPEMVDTYRKTNQHLGIFDNPANATSYAEILHQQQNQLYGPHGVMRQAKEPVPGMARPLSNETTEDVLQQTYGLDVPSLLAKAAPPPGGGYVGRGEFAPEAGRGPFGLTKEDLAKMHPSERAFTETTGQVTEAIAKNVVGMFPTSIAAAGEMATPLVSGIQGIMKPFDRTAYDNAIAQFQGKPVPHPEAMPKTFDQFGKSDWINFGVGIGIQGINAFLLGRGMGEAPGLTVPREPVPRFREVVGGEAYAKRPDQTAGPVSIEQRLPVVEEPEREVKAGDTRDTLAEQAKAQEQPSAVEVRPVAPTIKPEAEAAVERGRVEQNVRSMAEQIYQSAFDEQKLTGVKVNHPLRVEQAVAMQRLAAQARTNDPVVLQAFSEAHRLATEQADLLPGVGMERQGRWIEMGEAPGLQAPERLPTGVERGGQPIQAEPVRPGEFAKPGYTAIEPKGGEIVEEEKRKLEVPPTVQAVEGEEIGREIREGVRRPDTPARVTVTGGAPPAPPTAAEPPPTAPAPTVPVGGVSIKAMEQRPIVPPEPGHGVNWDESTRRGEAALDAGVDTRRLIADFRATGAISQPVMDTMRAQMLRFQARTNFAGDALRTRPNDKGLLARYQAALANEQSFADAYKPMHTVASNTLRSLQGTEPVTEEMAASHTGLQRKFRELNPGKDFDPQQTARADQIANGMKRANLEYAQANGELYRQMDREYKRIKTTRKGPPTIEDLGRIFGEGLDEVCDV